MSKGIYPKVFLLALSLSLVLSIPGQIGAQYSHMSSAQTFPNFGEATNTGSNPCTMSGSSGTTDIAMDQPTGGSSQENVTLPGHVVPDLSNGRASYKTRLAGSSILHMELVFKIQNSDQFSKCLSAISDPNSPYYGRFLSATDLAPFVPSASQKQYVISFLSKDGFTVTDGSSPLVVKVTGNVESVSRTFGVELGLYQENGKNFYSAGSDPRMPFSLGGLVEAIVGLDNYSSFRHLEYPCGLNSPECPQGIQVGYSFANLYSGSYDGRGQKVAIVDAPGDPNIQTALNVYSAQYGLPATTVDLRYPDGPPYFYDPSWASETAMDVETAHAVAPGAGLVLLYDEFDLMNAIDYVAANGVAKLVSNSWGYQCVSGPCSDTQLSSSFVSSVDSRLALDAAQGVTIVFASGDEGMAPDGRRLGTEFPASDPNVLAVGATNFYLTGCSGSSCSAYGSETGASISGGGYSGYFPEPSWQTSNIGAKGGRVVPDVAAIGYYPGLWAYSTASDRCGAGGSSPGWFGCSGSSLSTVLWAGFLAIALQMKATGSFGNIGPKLYQLANSPAYPSIFHDITLGSNGYSATTGWDPVTGWGSPIANQLAKALTQIATSSSSATTSTLTSFTTTSITRTVSTGTTATTTLVTTSVSTSTSTTGILCSNTVTTTVTGLLGAVPQVLTTTTSAQTLSTSTTRTSTFTTTTARTVSTSTSTIATKCTSTLTSATTTTFTSKTTTTTLTGKTTATSSSSVQLNVNLNLYSYKTANVLIQVCTDAPCTNVVGSVTAAVGPAQRTATKSFTLTLPPATYYVRISGSSIATQIKPVTFGTSPQTVTFIIF